MKKVFALFGTIALDGVTTIKKQMTGLDNDLKKFSKSLAKTGRDIQKVGVSMSKTFTAPIIAATGAMTVLATKTGEYADHLLDLEQITGLSTDSLQELDHVSKIAGVSFEGLTGIISKFTNQLPEIESGGSAASRAFAQLGVELRDTNGNTRDMNELFFDIIEALREVENVTDRNALAQDVFGRSLTDIAPVLGMTTEEFRKARGEAHATGVVLSKEALISANEFRKEMEKLKEQLGTAGREMAIEFIPLFRDVLFPLIKNKVVPAIRELADRVRSVIDWFMKLSPGLRDTVVKLTALLAVAGPFLIVVGKLTKSIAGLRATILLLNSAILTNPFTILAAGAALLTLKIVDNINKVRELKKEFNMMTVDAAARKEFVEGYDALMEKIKQSGEALKEEGAITKLLGKDVDELTEKARELGYTIEGNTSKRIESLNTIALEVQGVRDATGALIRYNNEAAKSVQAKDQKKQTAGLTEEDLKKQKEINEKFYAEDQAAADRMIELQYEHDQKELQADQEQADKMLEQRNEYIRKGIESAKSESDRLKRIQKDYEEYKKKSQQRITDYVLNLVYTISDAVQSSIDNEMIRLDEKYEKEKSNLENSLLSEEEKRVKIEALDEQTAKKKRQLARKQAILDKAMAIFSIGLSTAQGIMQAWASPGFPMAIPLTVLIAALGIAQTAIAAAKPIPKAEKGMYLPGTAEGTLLRAGEKNKPEIIFPLETGVDKLVTRIFERAKALPLQTSTSAAASAGGMRAPIPGTSGNVINQEFNIGSFFGNQAAMKEFARTVAGYMSLESTRLGAVT